MTASPPWRRAAWLALRLLSVGALMALSTWFVYSSIQRFYPFQWSVVLRYLPLFHKAMLVTVFISLWSMVLAMGLAIAVALARLSRWTAIADLAAIYVHALRNLPALIVILLFYFALGTAFPIQNISLFGQRLEELRLGGIRLEPNIVWGFLALAVFESAFIAEIFRAGIQSIHREQMESARSLGMTYLQSMRYVILPQAFRHVIPPLTGELIALVKESSLLSFISVQELTLTARQVGGSRYIYFEAILLAAVYYLALTLPLTALSHQLERRLSLDRDRERT